MRNHRAFSVFARWSNYQQKFCKKNENNFRRTNKIKFIFLLPVENSREEK
jgi:hypothetical protein